MLYPSKSPITRLDWAGVVIAAIVVLSGCQKPSPQQITALEPAAAAKMAFEKYDQNRDGKLSAQEMKESPPLLEGAKRADINHDGVLTVEEFQKRLNAAHAQPSLHLVQIRITSGGKPLRDASIAFVPESFLGEGRQSYSGKTTENGLCALQGDTRKTLGIPDGYYRVKIVQPEQGIDALRGCEIAADTTRDIIEIAL